MSMYMKLYKQGETSFTWRAIIKSLQENFVNIVQIGNNQSGTQPFRVCHQLHAHFSKYPVVTKILYPVWFKELRKL